MFWKYTSKPPTSKLLITPKRNSAIWNYLFFLNLEGSIKNQWSEDSVFYSWPELDLTDKSASLDEHLEKIENLVEEICNGEVVIESKYTNSKETDMILNHWNGFLLKLFIHQKLIQLKMIKEIFKKHDPPSISREVLEEFLQIYTI